MSFEDPQWKRGLAQGCHTPGVFALDSWGPCESCSSFNSLTQVKFLLELFHHRLSPPPAPHIGSPHALGSLFSITPFPFDSLLFCLHKPRAGQQILGLIRSSREISPLLAALLISMHGSPARQRAAPFSHSYAGTMCNIFRWVKVSPLPVKLNDDMDHWR